MALNVIGVWVGKGFIKDQNNAKLIELVLEDADVWGDSSFKNTLSLNLEAVKEEVSTEEALEMKVIDDIVTNEKGEACICGTIESVDYSYTWCYMACIRCTRKVVKLNNKFFCGTCNKYDGKANQRLSYIVPIKYC
ncbi:uncharacterized protein LOC130994690 isoform X2 [Salvia miltiorrhiza]|uniref:uncharacterized protein LOC130994690 isoform X2 n=1 Tax=Salvia miltiorrhiza TaxID=226208 RepID=UPI0025AC83E0|nr:uncharacterized protein LOC130994690 isoform X2 [Salvia miltiorrhiza]